MIPAAEGVGTCEICSAQSAGRVHTVLEMMFGLRDEFHYWECGECGCLQLLDPPSDWSKYYPSSYYSLGAPPPLAAGTAKRLLKRLRVEMYLRLRVPLGSCAYLGKPPAWLSWIKEFGIRRNESLLDVGAGSGFLVLQLREAGFTYSIGIDPYVADDLYDEARLRVRKLAALDVASLGLTFDMVVLHHSLEHMSDHLGVLRAVRQTLTPHGVAVVSLPVAGTFAWREYGPDWVQLDAPRHLVIHTERSMRIVAAAAGFRVERVSYDSRAFQFWGSEQYRRGRPLISSTSAEPSGPSSFGRKKIKEWEKRARELNHMSDGDSASFFLLRA